MQNKTFKFLSKNSNLIRLTVILLYLLAAMSFFVFTQPFGDGPDEINRYKVVEYIANHGTIPVGDDPEIIIDGYGASYAFQPMLTYIVEGYLLFLLKPLSLSTSVALVVARFVNVIIGLIAAVYTYKLSLLLFKKNDAAFLFTLAVVLLPQNIFIFTYVNTDGCGLLSCAMILFALVRGFKTGFDKESVITLGIGIILCLMSYYNCYGHVLAAFLAFILYYIVNKEIPKKEMFKKGGVIALLVAIGAGWWFIRNMILYNGDIFALTARKICAAETGNAAFLETMAETYQAMGYSLREMVFGTDYYTLVWKSFIGMFGPMAIPISHYQYMIYKYLTIICLLGLVIGGIVKLIKRSDTVNADESTLPEQKKSSVVILCGAFAICLVTPVILALIYSYSWDFQPQGRYYLPILLILAFILVKGLNKILNPIAGKLSKLSPKLSAMLYHIFYAFFFLNAMFSVWMMLKYYHVL